MKKKTKKISANITAQRGKYGEGKYEKGKY